MIECPEAGLLVMFGGLFGAALVSLLMWMNRRDRKEK
jgi:hypothetical protein